jgi:hypothetical protein
MNAGNALVGDEMNGTDAGGTALAKFHYLVRKSAKEIVTYRLDCLHMQLLPIQNSTNRLSAHPTAGNYCKKMFAFVNFTPFRDK